MALMLVPAIASADPTHISVIGEGGGWITGHSTSEVHAGVEADDERSVLPYLRLGGGVSLQYGHYSDDECFGFNALYAEAFGSALLDDAEPPSLHFLIGPRLGLLARRATPYCTSGGAGFHSTTLGAGYDLGGVAAIQVRHVRVQIFVGVMDPTDNDPPWVITVGGGYTF